jgi:hypothetical protein
MGLSGGVKEWLVIMGMTESPISTTSFSVPRRLKGGRLSSQLSWSAPGIDIRPFPKSLGISIRGCHQRDGRPRFVRVFSKAESLQESARNAINHPRRDPPHKVK